MNYPANMDPECITICNALNALPGIATHESCCGHGSEPHRIFFTSETVDGLAPVLRCSLSSAWSVEARWANGNDTVYFMLKGPIGAPDIPGGADDFASWLIDDMQSTSSSTRQQG